MTHPNLVLLSLIFCSAWPISASATDEDEACIQGKYRNVDTDGHCCWEGQRWDPETHQCVGLAECPAGFLPSLNGNDCEEEKCRPDQVQVGDGCCWPGQEWKTEKEKEGRCIGFPRCPSGWQATGFDCEQLSPLPPGDLRPYEGIQDGDYIRVDSGDYLRGSPRSEPGHFKNERQHPTFLTRAFMLKRTEVTQDEWLQLVPHNPARFRGCSDGCPVERVSWYEALTWLNRLSEKEGLAACYELSGCTGALGGGCRLGDGNPLHCAGDYTCSVVKWKGLDCPGYRLPTEAEWEYAARAGSKKATYMGSTTQHERLALAAWYGANSAVNYTDGVKCSQWAQSQVHRSLCGVHRSAQKTPSPWGHHDMHGNVMEWVWDAFHRYPKRSVVDPIRNVGLNRVVRGGSWASEAKGLRVAQRGRLAPGARNAMLGFRAARTVIERNVDSDENEGVSESQAGPAPKEAALEGSKSLGSAPLPGSGNALKDEDLLMDERPPRPPPTKTPYVDLEQRPSEQNADAAAAETGQSEPSMSVPSQAGSGSEIPPGVRIRVEVERKTNTSKPRKKKQKQMRKTKAPTSGLEDDKDGFEPRKKIPLKVIPAD